MILKEIIFCLSVDSKKSKKKEKSKSDIEAEEAKLPEVSSDRYFKVSDSLQDAFKVPPDTDKPQGFSLLAAFGGEQNSDEEIEKTGTIVLMCNGFLKYLFLSF